MAHASHVEAYHGKVVVKQVVEVAFLEVGVHNNVGVGVLVEPASKPSHTDPAPAQ